MYNRIDNFISRDTAYTIHRWCRERAELDPSGRLNFFITNSYLPNYHENAYLMQDLFDLISKAISHEIGYKKEKIKLKRINYQVLLEGQSIGFHTDEGGAYDKDMLFNGYSALLYLNDEYEGGEILFYKSHNGDESKADWHKPMPGTLIYFRGGEENPHSVRTILGGERSNLILFFDVDESL